MPMHIPGMQGSKLRVADLDESAAATMSLNDRLGRRQGKRLGALGFAVFAAKVGVRLRCVPGDYWSLDGTAAIIACPCGATPVVEALAGMVDCACGRYFIFDSVDVWALGSPPEGGADAEPVAEEPHSPLS
jgi:hypothetical protein